MSIFPLAKQSLSDAAKEQLRKYIIENKFGDSEKLLPEDALARQFSVSRITIRKALSDLEQEGLLLRIHGKGTFVNPTARQVTVNLATMQEFGSVIRQNGYHSRMELAALNSEAANETMVKQLQILPDSLLIRVEKLYYADQWPVIFSVGRIPAALFTRDPSRDDWSTYSNFDILREFAGRIVTRDCVEILSLSKKEAETLLGRLLPLACEAVLLIQAIGYDQHNTPVIQGQAYYDTSYIRFNLLRH
jgi:GntR family transcriptional regulator